MSWSAEAYQQRLRDIDRLTRENEALKGAHELLVAENDELHQAVKDLDADYGKLFNEHNKALAEVSALRSALEEIRETYDPLSDDNYSYLMFCIADRALAAQEAK